MLIRMTALIAIALALATASPAQEPPESPDGSEPVFYHGPPACDHTDRFCVWGQLFDGSGPNKYRPTPMKKGPIDVCRQWDYNCSAPYQTVCKLHGTHGINPGHWGQEGSYFFALPAKQTWRIKPRATHSHLSWEPTHKLVSARSLGRKKLLKIDFKLLGSAASTSACR